MKFTMAVMKHNRATVGRCAGHNNRLHSTESQLPKAAWFTEQGQHTVIEWDNPTLERARKLSTRKDAVLAIELIVQVGKQSDWRDLPTPDHPHGKPKSIEAIKRIQNGVRQAAVEIFDADNIIGIDLHTDESSPHFHVLVTPVFAGKLQAKHWLNGPAMVAKLRERVHGIVSAAFPCAYEKGGIGGLPHDPGKAAGAVSVDSDELRQRIKALEAENDSLFSRLKHLANTQEQLRVALVEKAEANERTLAAERRALIAEGKLKALDFDADETEPTRKVEIPQW